jgi:hypothetical protein
MATKRFISGNRLYKAFILLVTAFTLIACDAESTAITNPTVQKLPLAADWRYRWLKEIPCAPPCWEGVTPGKTTADQAIQILKQSPIVATANFSSFEKDSIILEWVTDHHATALNNPGGSMLFKPEDLNKTVFLIRPALRNYKFSEIIANKGEPTHILATFSLEHRPTPGNSARFDLQFHLYIVYLSSGFALSTQSSNEIILNPDLDLKNVEFFPADEAGFDSPGHPVKLLVPWQGFKAFKFYCRHANGPQKIAEDCSKIPGINF